MQEVIKNAKKLKTARDRNNYLQQFGLRDIQVSLNNDILNFIYLRYEQNVFWGFPRCDPYHALSFDRLHVDHDGLFGHHILGELIKRIRKLPSAVEQQADEQYVAYSVSLGYLKPVFRLKHFPWWRGLYRFKQGFMNIYFTDGKKYEALSKVRCYLYLRA